MRGLFKHPFGLGWLFYASCLVCAWRPIGLHHRAGCASLDDDLGVHWGAAAAPAWRRASAM